MSCSFGRNLKITIFGQSHSEAMGIVVDGLPPGIKLPMDFITNFMKRRAPGQNELSTARKETDTPIILSGTVDGITCGAPLCAIIKNKDAKSSDYESIYDIPRPMHADFAAFKKFGGKNDKRGGGQFSGRLTAPLCFGGAVALWLLAQKDIFIGAHILSLGKIKDVGFDNVNLTKNELLAPSALIPPVISPKIGEEMKKELNMARKKGDSLGGIIETVAIGVPIGLGDPNFDGLESRLSSNIFSIPAVKGIEFGAGFSSSFMQGSQHNDNFIIKNGEIKTETNNHGGILGGISTGMPINFKTAFKPTPSIALPQKSISLSKMEKRQISVKGRHDPSVVIRAVPVVEAVTALTLFDFMLEEGGKVKWN